MRGTRAKKLRKEAVKNPSFTKSGWIGKTFIHGGAKRAYKDLKKAWK